MSLGKLLVKKGSGPGTLVAIAKLPLEIGRVESNQLVLIDERASRQHAKIDLVDGVLSILDLGSKNGTFVNGKKIRTHPLAHGDRIEIGSTVIEFELEAATAQTQITDEIPIEDAVQPDADWSPFARLLRAQIPAKAIAVQAIQLLQSRFQAERCCLSWENGTSFFLQKGRRDPLPKAERFDVPDISNPSPEVRLLAKPGQPARLAAPLFSKGALRGWLCLEAANPEAFTLQHRQELDCARMMLEAALERSAMAEKIVEHEKKLSLVEKYVSREVLEDIFTKESDIRTGAMEAEEREVTVLFSDIQGFTPLSEKLAAPELAALLNGYFERMVEIITRNGGEVNKFIGDAVMALFGAHESRPDDAYRAIRAGLEMIRGLQEYWREIAPEKRFNIRVGINTGVVVVGNMGSQKKLEFTVLGDPVNVASRLESIAGTNEVYAGKRTAELCQDRADLRLIPNTRVKGKSREIDVYQVLGLKGS